MIRCVLPRMPSYEVAVHVVSLGCVWGHGGHDILYYAPKKRNGCISCIRLYRVLDECTKRKSIRLLAAIQETHRDWYRN